MKFPEEAKRRYHHNNFNFLYILRLDYVYENFAADK